jgi:hypothetical protein
MITSPALFGAGVPAYAASKSALVGLSNSIQFEANKLRPRNTHDIKCNAIIPFASTRMTNEFASDVDSIKKRQGKKVKKPSMNTNKALEQLMHPSMVSSMVGYLCHENCSNEAQIFEAGAGYFSQIRFERSLPLFATRAEGVHGPPTPEHVQDGQVVLNTFEGDVVPTGDGSMGGNPVVKVMKHISQTKTSKL